MSETRSPAVAFAAKSTIDAKGSIGTQLQDCRALAEQEGLELVAEFRDEAASAYSGDRGPGLAEAIAESERQASEHGSCALIVQHSDRLARGDAKRARHLIEIVLWALKHNVQLLSVQDPEILAGGDYGLLMGAVGGMRNFEDSKRKGKSVKDGLKRRVVERGRYVGGRRPYGYRWASECGDNGQVLTTKDGRIVKRLRIDESESAIVRRIFREYVSGVSQRQTALDLKAEGVQTLTGADWYATTVAGMLRNPLYTGRVVLGGESFPAVGPDGKPTHEAIIDPETWDLACQLREATSRTRGGGRGRKTRGSHLFTNGLLVCTCGAPMSPVTKDTRTPGVLYETYVCAHRLHHGPTACAQPPIKRHLIDGAVWRYFEQVALDVESTRQMVSNQASQKLAEFDALRQQAELELARAEAALTRIEGDYIAGKIDAEKWTRLEDRLRGEMAAAKAQTEQQERQRQSIAAEIAEFDAETAIAEELTALRKLVVDEAQSGSRRGLDPFRVTLRRLFAGFELSSPTKPFGSGALRGQGDTWSPADPDASTLQLEDGYYLLPVVRPEAVDLSLSADYGEGFPAVRRSALAIHDNLCSRLAAW